MADPKPLAVMSGLNDAIISPLWNDFKDAYWMQRAVRTRYPVADGALNFVPYAGAAANLADIAHDVATNKLSDVPGDALGLALNASLAKRWGSAVLAAAPQAGGPALAVGALPFLGYATELAHKQQKANDKYGESPMAAIAELLRNAP